MYGTGGLFVRCGSALVLVLLLILVLVLLGIAVLTGVLVLVALVAVLILILVLVLILVHDGHLLLYLRYRDSVTGIGENMHGSVQKNANDGAGVVPEDGIWYNAGIIF